MSSRSCPYCHNTSLTPTSSLRNRKETETLVVCSDCEAFSIRVANGLVWPLARRDDPDSDVGQRVIG